VTPGTVFLLSPGRTHKFDFSDDVEGWIIFHTAVFFDLQFHAMRITDYPFYSSVYNSPKLEVPKSRLNDVLPYFQSIHDEYRHNRLLRAQKSCLDIAALYTELTRLYIIDEKPDNPGELYFATYRTLQGLIDTRYREFKSPQDYANLLMVSEKHLNFISKNTVNRTISQLINDRVLLEAKKMLVYSGKSISQISVHLGFSDASYFSRFFKKNAGTTPRNFMRSHRGKQL
jgi:AraC family transcriptional activator of pobA